MNITIQPNLLRGSITPPPSKSQAHRVIIAAALSDGVCRLSNLALSEDIRATLRCMRTLDADASGDGSIIRGADLVDGTPILDIKPYLPYCDAKPQATGGFTDGLESAALQVVCPPELLARLPEKDRPGLLAVLGGDPRPRYQDDPERVYGLTYGQRNVKFRVAGDVLTVEDVE